MPIRNSEPPLNIKGRFQFGKLPNTPLDHYADRRRAERRLVVVNTTKRVVHILSFVIFTLVIGVGITGIVVYTRFEELNRKLLVEETLVPQADFSEGPPVIEEEILDNQSSPNRGRR